MAMQVREFRAEGRGERFVAGALRLSLQLLLAPGFSPRRSIALQRRWLASVARLTLVPRAAHFETARLGGVPGEWASVSPRPPEAFLLYLHGGAYCLGSPATHRALTGRLALRTGLRVLALDYRLAPEHRFPAALDDALAAYGELSARGPVVIAGDSAGGGLALATAIALRKGPLISPAALVLFSPWVDLTLERIPLRPPHGEAMLSRAWAEACAAHYLGGTPASNPLASPIHADLHGLPPTLIQAGTDELLHAEAIRLHTRLQESGVSSVCEITSERWHVFQMHGGILRSADEALDRVAGFLDAIPGQRRAA